MCSRYYERCNVGGRLMNIIPSDDKLYNLQAEFNTLDPIKAISMNHYELAKNTGIDADKWREFLMDGRVAKFISQEMELYKDSQMKKLIANATTNEKSVGAAQMLNAIGKTLEEEKQEQNFFVYSHVPLTENEKHAPLTRSEPEWAAPQNIHDTPEKLEELIETHTDKAEDIPDPKIPEKVEDSFNDNDWL